eukprot:7709323-Lingulodinium_polyedra.AAC.1
MRLVCVFLNAPVFIAARWVPSAAGNANALGARVWKAAPKVHWRGRARSPTRPPTKTSYGCELKRWR